MLSFHVKFVQTDGLTDRQTDRRADNGKTICPQSFDMGAKKLTSERRVNTQSKSLT